MAIATIFKKTWAPYTVSGYALLKGLALGGISHFFEQQYPGIVSQAIFLTFGILAALLLAYKMKLIKPTENFKLGVFAATAGIGILYLIHFFGTICCKECYSLHREFALVLDTFNFLVFTASYSCFSKKLFACL